MRRSITFWLIPSFLIIHMLNLGFSDKPWGKNAIVGQFPWAVGIDMEQGKGKYVPICAGSLIATDLVLTAAHCVPYEKMNECRVLVGAVSTPNSQMDNQFFAIVNVTQHPWYISDDPTLNRRYDLSILEMDDEANLSKHVSLVPLVSEEESQSIFYNSEATSLTWETTYGGAALMYEELTIKPNVDCIIEELDEYMIDDHLVCIHKNVTLPEHEYCLRNTGGPLIMYNGTESAHQIGLSVKGLDCKDPNSQTYVRIGPLLPWIKMIIKLNDHMSTTILTTPVTETTIMTTSATTTKPPVTTGIINVVTKIKSIIWSKDCPKAYVEVVEVQVTSADLKNGTNERRTRWWFSVFSTFVLIICKFML